MNGARSQLALISAQLWWFLFSKPKSQQAETSDGIQEVSITVDGGYIPAIVTVKRGLPVRLKFMRRDPSSCLEKVLFPDFHIAQDLGLNVTTPVEFTPQTVGNYQFSCGMNMFHGAINVQHKPQSTTGQPLFHYWDYSSLGLAISNLVRGKAATIASRTLLTGMISIP
ncbi:MAG: cupredoxin domain-containing protein [Pseudanabaena sp. Salubria-1]|nr:cupredoxin domain-containing protein [Pseudanabaena sp. Salubria-1]